MWGLWILICKKGTGFAQTAVQTPTQAKASMMLQDEAQLLSICEAWG